MFSETSIDASFYYTCGQGMESRHPTTIDIYNLRHDLYIDFCMNIYDMKTSTKPDQPPNIPDINIRQYEDGHMSTMSILKSFSVTGQWCITGALATFGVPYLRFYLRF